MPARRRLGAARISAAVRVDGEEITENDLIGAQTLANITHRAHERGLEVRRDDVRFHFGSGERVRSLVRARRLGESVRRPLPQFRGARAAAARASTCRPTSSIWSDAWFAGGNMPPAATGAGRHRPQRAESARPAATHRPRPGARVRRP
jgi:hypothetical protein